MAERWFEVTVPADPEAADAVAERLRGFGGGIAIEVPFIQLTPDEDPQPHPAAPVLVRTYLPAQSQPSSSDQLCLQVEEALWPLGRLRPVGKPTVRLIAEEDWANAWKAFFPVVSIGRGTVIVPAWRRYRRRPGQVVVRLDPGMAFGTGTHPTTRLCLEAIEGVWLTPNPSVLDVGTGSGILAIAAAGHGASHVTALDIDPVAVSAARANVRLNHLSRRISVVLGSPEAAGPWARHAFFDLVLANLTARENIRLAGYLRAMLAAEGRLVASGILREGLPSVLDAFARGGLEVVEQRDEGDWVAVVAKASA